MASCQPIRPIGPLGTRQSICRTILGGNAMLTVTGAVLGVPAGQVAVNWRISSATAAPGSVGQPGRPGLAATGARLPAAPVAHPGQLPGRWAPARPGHGHRSGWPADTGGRGRGHYRASNRL